MSEEITGQKFEQETVILDGKVFVDCQFIDCELKYDGGELPAIRGEETAMPGSRLTLGDTAKRPLEYLSILIRSEVPFFRRFAERVVSQIGSASETASALELAPTSQLIEELRTRQSFVGLILSFDMPLERLRRFWQRNPDLPPEDQPKLHIDHSRDLDGETILAILQWVLEKS